MFYFKNFPGGHTLRMGYLNSHRSTMGYKKLTYNFLKIIGHQFYSKFFLKWGQNLVLGGTEVSIGGSYFTPTRHLLCATTWSLETVPTPKKKPVCPPLPQMVFAITFFFVCELPPLNNQACGHLSAVLRSQNSQGAQILHKQEQMHFQKKKILHSFL